MKILVKTLLIFLVLSFVPLAILSAVTIDKIDEMTVTASKETQDLGSQAIADSTAELNKLGEQIIKQKAIDVAKQLEVYIKAHPTMTVADLQQDPAFKALAVQPVGLTGYTAVTDSASLIARFHAKNTTVNLDLHVLAEKLPGFWGVMAASEGGKESSGLYDWKEPDGSIKKKYMFIAPVDARTADGVQFTVAATTYIDEFSLPMTEISGKITGEIDASSATMNVRAEAIKNLLITITIITMVIAVFAGVFFANLITKPLKQMTEAGNKIAEGKLDTKVPEVTTKDEIQDLSLTMTILVDAVKSLKSETETKKRK
jgi:HAMP domain-containing protein